MAYNVVGKLKGDLCDLVGHSGFHQTTSTGQGIGAGDTCECVYVCFRVQMHTLHMAVWYVCGRKGY